MKFRRRRQPVETDPPPAGPADTGDLGAAVAELEHAMARFELLRQGVRR